MARTGLVVVNRGLAKKYLALAKAVPSIRDTAMNTLAEGAKVDFKKTVRTWHNPPSFNVVKRARSWTVATDDKRFLWVDKGTKKHKIPVGEKGFLAFRGSYQAKTTPRVIRSRAGGSSGPYVYTQKTIDHPGTKARHFTDTVFTKHQKKVLPTTRKALRAGIEAVGL